LTKTGSSSAERLMDKNNWIKSYVPIILSCLAVFVSVYGPGAISDYFYQGELIVQNPVGYAILNKTHLNSSQDVKEYCVILTIDFINTYKNTRIIVNNTSLVLSIDNKPDELLLEGEYPSINTKSFLEDYMVIHSLILEPNSVSGKILVFKSMNSSFYVDSAKNMTARIRYKTCEVGNTQSMKSNEVLLFDLPRLNNYRPDERYFPNSKNYWYYRDLR
jgi:hypothetical protein